MINMEEIGISEELNKLEEELEDLFGSLTGVDIYEHAIYINDVLIKDACCECQLEQIYFTKEDIEAITVEDVNKRFGEEVNIDQLSDEDITYLKKKLLCERELENTLDEILGRYGYERVGWIYDPTASYPMSKLYLKYQKRK